ALSQTTPPPVVAIPQFDTQGGYRVLDSVEIVGKIDLETSISGNVTNRSSTAATYEATVTNASISLSGTGYSSPLTASQSTLLDTGPINIPKGTTAIGPFSASLANTSDSTLTTAID